jgi:pimeloyl-ACP methyl ester carboxylesterase
MLIASCALRGRGRAVLRLPFVRHATLYSVVANPSRIASDAVVKLLTTFEDSRAVLAPLLRAARTTSFRDGQSIAVPITIAYGTHDRMVHPPARAVRDHLPPHTRWLDLPGCGHVPMSDDPHLVARTILDGTG